MSKWKIFNFRPLFFVFTMLIVGILFANYISSKTYLSVTILVVAIGIMAFYCLGLKKYGIFLLGLIVVVIGVGDFYFEKKRVDNYTNFAGAVVSATIESVEHNAYGYTYIVCDLETTEEKIKGRCELNYNIDEATADFKIGDVIIFEASEFATIDIYGDNEPWGAYVKSELKYQVYTTFIEKVGSAKTFQQKIHSKIKDNLSLGLSGQKLELVYSCLFGDRTGLSEDVYDSFIEGGVAHLLAVSGLNVVLIVAVLTGILKLFRCGNKTCFIVNTIMTIVYCYLCNWSPSIARSGLMCLIVLLAPLVFGEYDSLSSLALSGLIILFISPSALFDISFLLSFGCVFGISMVYPYVNKFLNKIHFNNPVSQTLMLSAISIIASTFITMHYFESLSFVGIISNILILPLFTFVFSVVFIIAMISLICPYICYILVILQPIINLVIILSNYFASISIYYITTKISFLAIILSMILWLFIGKFNVKKRSIKLLSISLVTVLLILQIILNLKVIPL